MPDRGLEHKDAPAEDRRHALRAHRPLIVHELTHLIDRRHNDRFVSLMNRHLPHWRHHRKALNEAPLGHADWTY
ncbi:MAG: M48 family metallopeptidase [Candidatus Rokubacteria bacterium]|nr:M48 family metallopeptidase [Candidatus Rokubacteria bacterium]